MECFFGFDLAGEGGGEEVVEVAHDHLQGRELGLLSLEVWQVPKAGTRSAGAGGGLRSWKADGMDVRQARAADWEALRELRLRALAEVPDAFASTLQQELAFPERVWRQRAKGGAGSVSFIACEGGAGIGMAAIFKEADAPGRMHLVGMWVDPQHRRRGVAQAPALMESLLRRSLENDDAQT